MKLLPVLFLVGTFYLERTSALLSLNQPIPTNWASNLRYYDYVKDNDDCHMGYRISHKTNQVINVFNCTDDDPAIFYVLKLRTCGASYHVLGSETCDYTPDYPEDDNQYVADDNCRMEARGVAPDPTNCVRFLECGKDKRYRFGRKTCLKGLYFSNSTYRCEHMWQSGPNGTIISLSDLDMCQNRPIPAGSRRNLGNIMYKCSWRWNAENINTYSVAEPLNCQIYYLCSRLNVANIESSVTTACTDTGTYWSDSLQRCVTPPEMTQGERQECNLRV